MRKKTVVSVVTPDGTSKTVEADSVLIFTVDKALEFMHGDCKVDKNIIFRGRDIPELIFIDIMGSLFSSYLEQTGRNKVMAAFHMSEISDAIRKRGKAITKNMSREDLASNACAAYLEALMEAFKDRS